MKVMLAQSAGFCFGVRRAVQLAEKIAAGDAPYVMLGPVIHNDHVIKHLAEQGVGCVERVDQVPPGCGVIIRSHGEGKAVYDKLQEMGCPVADATCVKVAKIHQIVQDASRRGRQVIIIGDPVHPEVTAIAGWCTGAKIFRNATELGEFLKEYEENPQKPITLVSQTTSTDRIWSPCREKVKKECTNAEIFDTICSATKDRQKEADELSRNSDMMIVIGGKESSNTRKLFEISKRNCKHTYHIETFEDLPQEKTYNKIGITAGASTPGSIIEEVVKAMSENLKNEENFAELFAQYESKTLNNGDIVEGTVVEVRNNEVIVDLGGFKYNGQLAADQLTDDPALKPSDVVKEGDTIKVYVVGVNDAEGKVVLSRKKLVAMESWNKIKEAYESGETLEGKIIKAVKGGVIALTDGSQVFIPARQASGRFVQDLQSLVGTTVNYKIIEIDERRRRVIGSVRVILEAARKEKEEKFWAEAEVGKKYQGTVKSLTSFGAFVDIGGVDGLVHISELSWNKIKHPSEVVKEGDVLDVYIKDLNRETKKISLGFKKIEDNPWTIAQSKINVGDVVKCKIVRMMPFGAFAEIMPNVDGLIHISQIADRRIGKPEDVLTIGEEVEAKVTDLNWDEKKISLSIRALIPTPEKEEEVKEEEAPVEDHNAETLVYSTDPEVEVEEAVEVEADDAE